MQRVMIVGGPGSGKSTLAQALSVLSGLPVFHIDHIHWQAGWVERPRAAKIALCRQVHAQDRWIFEGGMSVTYAERLVRADTLIWLDLPVGLRFWRVLRRTAVYLGQTRPDLPYGCREALNHETLPFWRFIWRTRQTCRLPLLAIVASPPPHLRIVHLRNRAEVRQFLESNAPDNPF